MKSAEEILKKFTKAVQDEFKDENWEYLDFIAVRVLNELKDESPSPSVEQEAEANKFDEWHCPLWSNEHVRNLKNSYFYAMEAALVHLFNYDLSNTTAKESHEKARLIKLLFNSIMFQGQTIVDEFLNLFKEVYKVDAISHQGLSVIAGINSKVEDGWMKCEDELPKDNSKYLCSNQYGAMYVLWYNHVSEHWVDGVLSFDKTHSQPITHWRKLPTPPKQ